MKPQNTLAKTESNPPGQSADSAIPRKNGGATLTPLAVFLRERIRKNGPVTVGEYMAECLGHPQYGYYMQQDPLGAGGDFVTAPEITQMFGEVIGAWCAYGWEKMGRPSRFMLAELGPGRGTLMKDVLRAGRVMPGFVPSAEVHLVETSRKMRARQKETLSGHHAVRWHDSVQDLPPLPAIVLANEFLDALPVRQCVRSGGRWHERMVGWDEDRQSFAFLLSEAPLQGEWAAAAPRQAQDGAVFEFSPARQNCFESLCVRIGRQGGMALLIDYGFAQRNATGDTFQAVLRHEKVSPFTRPGEADLTSHVDFPALAGIAQSCGLHVAGPVAQGDFLLRLGIDVRARLLQTRSTPEQAAQIRMDMERLVNPHEMGQIFKVLAVAHPSCAALEGFA